VELLDISTWPGPGDRGQSGGNSSGWRSQIVKLLSVVNAWDEFDQQSDLQVTPVRRKPHWAVKAAGALIILFAVISAGLHHQWIVFGIGVGLVTVVAIGTVGMFIERRRSEPG
jgi:hypothetical protein